MKVSKSEVKSIGDQLGIDWNSVDLNELVMGASEEAEHDTGDPQTDVLPGAGNVEKWVKIALAHLQEDDQYYSKLKKAMKENKEYDQALYVSSWHLKIYKRVGGDLTQTLNEIRSIRNVTTVFRADEGKEDASEVNAEYHIKFILRRRQNPVDYVKKILRPGLSQIEGLVVSKFMNYEKLK